MKRTTPQQYQNLIEVFSDQEKVNFREAAAWVGVDRSTAEQAYKRGWPGNPATGRGALRPIKDILEQQTVAASAAREHILATMPEETKLLIEKAIKDGAITKALEGVVSRSMLTGIDRQMQTYLKLTQAATPLVDKLVSKVMTMANERDVSMPEMQAILSFIAGYGRETAILYQAYANVEKVRTQHAPAKDEDPIKDKDPRTMSFNDAVEGLASMITALKKTVGAVAPTTKVIDVEAGQPSSQSSSLSLPSSSSPSSSSSRPSSSE